MKTLLTVIIILLIGCASTPNPPCDIVIRTQVGFVEIPQGFLDSEENYITSEQFEIDRQKAMQKHMEMMKQYQEEMQKQSL